MSFRNKAAAALFVRNSERRALKLALDSCDELSWELELGMLEEAKDLRAIAQGVRREFGITKSYE